MNVESLDTEKSICIFEKPQPITATVFEINVWWHFKLCYYNIAFVYQNLLCIIVIIIRYIRLK